MIQFNLGQVKDDVWNDFKQFKRELAVEKAKDVTAAETISILIAEARESRNVGQFAPDEVDYDFSQDDE